MTPDPTWEAQYARRQGLRWWPHEAVIRFLAAHPPMPGDVALEVGCGTGANLWALADAGYRTVGLDSSPAALRLATAYLARRGVSATLVLGALPELPILPATMQGVLDVQTTQHVLGPAIQTALATLVRTVVPGGWVFSYALADETTDYAVLFPTSPPARLVTRAQLRALWEGAGVRMLGIEGIRREYGDGRVAAHWALTGRVG